MERPVFNAFLDKNVKRKIFSLEVRCPMWRRGCRWVGELRQRSDHLHEKSGSCEVMDVDCTSGCGGRVQRRELPTHLAQSCPLRQYTCDHCVFEATYKVVCEQHWPVCENYPILCPNKCPVGEVKRCDLHHHLEECPLQEVECDFQYAGCTVKVQRKDMYKHMDECVHHHLKVLSLFTLRMNENLTTAQGELQERVQQLTDELVAVRSESQQKVQELADELVAVRSESQQKVRKLTEELGAVERKSQQLTEELVAVKYESQQLGAVDPDSQEKIIHPLMQQRQRKGDVW